MNGLKELLLQEQNYLKGIIAKAEAFISSLWEIVTMRRTLVKENTLKN